MIAGWWTFFGICAALALACGVYAVCQALDDLQRIAFKEDRE